MEVAASSFAANDEGAPLAEFELCSTSVAAVVAVDEAGDAASK